MIRVLFFVLVIFLLGLGFAWLADRPGDMVVTFSGYQYQVTLMVAAVVVVAIVAAVMFVWWLLRGIWNSPYTISRHFRVRRRDRGYQALSTGMIAAGSGDAAAARRLNKLAAKLINADQEPLIHLLEAQTLLLEGDHDRAREKFRTMLDDPELRILGLRGLYLEADRLGHRDVARHYASEAAKVAPQLAWAADVSLEREAENGDWDAALRLLDAQQATGRAERSSVGRRRAVLLTAKAMSALDADPLAAKNAALEANRLAPELVPASLVAARALFRLNDLRRGSKLLEAAWKKEPHPEIAETYIHARPGDSTRDRLARAEKLRSIRPNNAQSAQAMARAALDAGDFSLAHEEAEAAIRLEPSESVYLLRADIEEAETGDHGRVRFWLQKAVKAPRDAAWVADGYISRDWAPISPVSGRLDAFEWQQPVERIGKAIEADGGELQELPPPVTATKNVSETIADPASAIPARGSPLPVSPQGSEEAVRSGETVPALPKAEAVAQPKLIEEAAYREEALDDDEPLTARPPDDPGVDQPEIPEAPRRFRLF